MSVLDQIKRAQAAKDGLLIAALLPSAEELANRVMGIDPEATEAEALEFGHHAREAALKGLEELLTDTAEEDG